MNNLVDIKYRTAAFNWLHEQVAIHGDVLSRDLLALGFDFNGERIRLLGPQGIWKPKVMSEYPLSITTTFESQYDDGFEPNGLLRYHYRGNDPMHRDNLLLFNAMRDNVPLIYFFSPVPSRYLAVWPVYIVGDNPASSSVVVAADDEQFMKLNGAVDSSLMVGEGADARRLYVTSTVKVRLHQRAFRERVIDAYREQCALCQLRHRELLDAAHIIPDSDPMGEPLVTNGLSLCKIHHAAFDSNFLGIRPDYRIEIRNDILKEEDGPMLKHGLQGLHNQKIVLPLARNLHPDRKLLEMRYEHFIKAG
jgi:putative restriction endonuclease